MKKLISTCKDCVTVFVIPSGTLCSSTDLMTPRIKVLCYCQNGFRAPVLFPVTRPLQGGVRGGQINAALNVLFFGYSGI